MAGEIGHNVPLEIHDILLIGENDYGWEFAVGRIGERWLGFARDGAFSQHVRQAFASEGLAVEPGYMHLFPEVAEGVEIGLPDKERAILLTGALAQDPEQPFGGIDRWHVPEEQRGKPDDFRCPNCDRVGCDQKECQEDDYGEDVP